MSLVEIVRGTPAEREARATVDSFHGIRPTAPLADKQAFDRAAPLSRRLSRRRFVTGASFLGAAATTGGGILGIRQALQPSSLELLEAELAVPISPEALQTVTNEVASFYTQQTYSDLTAEQMAKRVAFPDFNGFAAALEGELGRTLSADERRKERHNRLEITTADGHVFFNTDLLNEVSRTIVLDNIEADSSQRMDISRIDVLKSALFHAFSHVNQENTELTFDPFSLSIPGAGLLNFDTMSGYTFVGQDEKGEEKYISGTEEAVTERTAIVIGSRMDNKYLSIGGAQNGYAAGADMIAMINQMANIQDEEFLVYMNGQRQKEEYLRRISALANPTNNDIRPAIFALATVGLAVDGIINQEEARSSIFGTLLNPNS